MSNSRFDEVHRPKHYTEGRKFEPKDVIRDWGLNFNLGSAVKYLSRAGRKGDIVEDLKKAQEFIQFEIDALEAEPKKAEPKAPTHPVSNTPTPNRGCSSCEERKSCADAYTEASFHCGNFGGRQVGVIELAVPKGTPPEEVIKMAIQKIYGMEE